MYPCWEHLLVYRCSGLLGAPFMPESVGGSWRQETVVEEGRSRICCRIKESRSRRLESDDSERAVECPVQAGDGI